MNTTSKYAESVLQDLEAVQSTTQPIKVGVRVTGSFTLS